MASKETTPVYEESSDPHPDTKGVVMVITTRQEGHGGCSGPLRPLLSLSLNECSRHRSFSRAMLASGGGGPSLSGKGTKRDRKGAWSSKKVDQDSEGESRG